MPSYLLAHDLGTSGNKATLFSEQGQLIASCTQSYDTHYFHGNWAEQNPADWWHAVCATTRQPLSDWIRGGQLAASEFVTHEFPLDQIHAALQSVREGAAVKCLLRF